ncbi:FG-GAP repeat domain-containing protein [Pendulispora albinea]|uniref:VCBS repeat-containing protein n=1 Tax=Pendulispora albinea TaxID=2741071 RepID=A0ABZ2LWK7_9BACT
MVERALSGVLAAGILTMVAGCAAGPGPRAHTAEPISDVYRPLPSFESAMDGSFATGVAFADLDGDGLPDMIVGNGNDMSPQPLMVYYNHCSAQQTSCFNHYPDWYSDDIDYLGAVALGDIDHDGRLDVAVSVTMDKRRLTRGGGIKIYMNQGGRLESLPSQRIAEGYGTFDNALADVNADGLLDLVVPGFNLPATEPVQKGPHAVRRSFARVEREPTRIYLNEGGKLHGTSDWKSENRVFGLGVVAADLDQDGWMDFAIAGEAAFVYRGGPPRGNAIPIDRKPSWVSEQTRAPVTFVDAGRIGIGPGLTLAAARGCFPGDTGCGSDFVLFRPGPTPGSRRPVWTSEPSRLSAEVLLADLNADGLLDLVAGQWGDEVIGAPLWIFQGQLGGFAPAPSFKTDGGPQGLAVAEGLAVSDTRNRATRDRPYAWRPPARGAVITLPDRRVASVVSVTIGGQIVPPNRWAFANGENWISLADPYEAGADIRIIYRASPVLDLIEATWNPQRGNLLYDSFLTPP